MKKINIETFQKLNKIAFDAKTLSTSLRNLHDQLKAITQMIESLRSDLLKINEDVLAEEKICKNKSCPYMLGNFTCRIPQTECNKQILD